MTQDSQIEIVRTPKEQLEENQMKGKRLLSLMITRNDPNFSSRLKNRLTFLENVKDLVESPEKHMGAAIHMISKNGPFFEAGLILGYAAACATHTEKGLEAIEAMTADINAQQSGPSTTTYSHPSDEAPEGEKVECKTLDNHPEAGV